MIDAYTHLYEPGATGAPLFVVFHGTGGNERQFAGLAAQLLPGSHLLAPRGDVNEMGALRFFRRTGEGVYDMADLARATAKMAGFVQAHREMAGVSRVVGLGYSNGANILAAISFAVPGLFSDLALMHPLIPFEPERRPGHEGTRVLVTAGRHDPICPSPQSERLIAWYDDRKADVTSFWHEGGHEITQGELAAVAGFLAPLRQEVSA